MSEENPQNKNTEKTKRHTWRPLAVLFIAFIVAITCCYIWQKHIWNAGTIDQRLAAIDAELAIPDFENAAVYYRRFFTDSNNASALGDLARYAPSAYCEPWADSEHPELATELKTHSKFIQTLLDISEMEHARFPAYPDPGSRSFTLADMRKLTFILSWAAANDLAEGRIDSAYSKYRCQLKLAYQLQQQPATYYRLVAIAFEAVALGNITRVVMRDDITPEQLKSLETILEIPSNQDKIDGEITDRVDRLIEEKVMSELSLVARLNYLLHGMANRNSLRRGEQRQYQRINAVRQAIRILISLRRYKDKTGVWPETLEQIEPKLPEQMLIDPQNNSPFIYKRAGENFIFYSKGPNNIDESGSYSGPADDWPIWPLKIKTTPAEE
jgi:hypothetical protein